jgi:hypothetical protein
MPRCRWRRHDRLGRPDFVSYTDIADAFTPKNENGEPEHTLGYLTFLEAGADIPIGIFAVLHFASSGWVHVLRGRVENDQQHVEVFKFASSMPSFQTRQAVRSR